MIMAKPVDLSKGMAPFKTSKGGPARDAWAKAAERGVWHKDANTTGISANEYEHFRRAAIEEDDLAAEAEHAR